MSQCAWLKPMPSSCWTEYLNQQQWLTPVVTLKANLAFNAGFACLHENLDVFIDQWCEHSMHVENVETTENTEQTNPSTPTALCFHVQHNMSGGPFIKYIGNSEGRQPSFLFLVWSFVCLGFASKFWLIFVTFISMGKNSDKRHDPFIHREKPEKLLHTKCGIRTI